eukprot:364631-Chlamydomonas_euryale.AAC.19
MPDGSWLRQLASAKLQIYRAYDFGFRAGGLGGVVGRLRSMWQDSCCPAPSFLVPVDGKKLVWRGSGPHAVTFPL